MHSVIAHDPNASDIESVDADLSPPTPAARQQKVGQIAYFISSFATFGLAFVMNVVFAHWMTAQDFGHFKFSTNFALMIPALVLCGASFSFSRLVAHRNPHTAKPLISSSLAATFVWSIVVIAGLYLLQWLTGLVKIPIFSQINAVLTSSALVIPFISIFMLLLMVNAAYLGLGKVLSLSAFNVVPYLVMVILGCLIGTMSHRISYELAVVGFIIANGVLLVPRIALAGGKPTQWRKELITLYSDIRLSGFYIYLGALVTNTASMIVGLVIGAQVGHATYGFYALAISLAMGFQTIASATSVAKFRQNVLLNKIPLKDFMFIAVVGVAAYLVFFFLIDIIFFWFYPHSMAETINYLRILGIAYLLFGYGEYLNKFLLGKGEGRLLFKVTALTGLCNIVLSCLAGFRWGLLGLSWATVSYAVVLVCAYSWAYRSVVNKLQAGGDDSATF